MSRTISEERRMKMSSSEKSMPKRIACSDIVPGCTFTAHAPSEEALLEQVAAHAARDHGVSEVTPELAAKVRAAIKSQ
jgi:predicted small metal-binding protein